MYREEIPHAGTVQYIFIRLLTIISRPSFMITTWMAISVVIFIFCNDVNGTLSNIRLTECQERSQSEDKVPCE